MKRLPGNKHHSLLLNVFEEEKSFTTLAAADWKLVTFCKETKTIQTFNVLVSFKSF